MPKHVANHNINDAAANGQCDSFRSRLDVMAYSFNVLNSDVEIFRFLLMCQPLVFFPSSFVIQVKVLRVIIRSKWRSFERPSRQRFFRRAFATKAYAKLAVDNNNFRRHWVTGYNGKSFFDIVKKRHPTKMAFKIEIKFFFDTIKKQHPTKMKYGTYGFY
jgi:hypothetical protein